MTTQRVFNLPDGFGDAPEPEPQQPLSKLAQWSRTTRSGKAKKPRSERPRKTTVAAAVFERTRVEAQAMIDSQNFDGCSARHIVAIYDLMHLKIYGVEVSMSATDRHTYTLRAGGFVKREFSGDYAKMIVYFRWLWSREMGREQWRRETGNEGASLHIAACFAGKAITEYRIALSRRK